MSVYEMAKKYYPRLWGVERLDALLEAGKLTKTQYNKIIKEAAQNED